MMSNQHVLKIHPAPLADLLSGAKTAEVCRNDRGFQVGDTVRLMEVNPETGNWTGAADHVRTISHIQTGYGLPDGMCVLSYADTAQREALAQLAQATKLLGWSKYQLMLWEDYQVENGFEVEDHYVTGKVREEVEAFLARHAQAEPATFYDAIKNPPTIAPTLQQEAQVAQAVDERAAFEEAWIKLYRIDVEKCPEFHPKTFRTGTSYQREVGGDYIGSAWWGWQARAALATQPAAGEPEQQTAINADDLPTKKYPIGALDFAAPVAAGEPATSAKHLADALKLVRCFERQGQAPEWEFEVPGSFNRHVVASSEQVARAKVAQDVRREAPPAAAHGDGLHFSTTEDLASAIRQVSAYEDLGPELIAEEIFKRAGAIDAAHGDEAVRARLCEAYESGYQDGQKWPDSYSIQADKDKVADALIAAMRAQAGEGDKV